MIDNIQSIHQFYVNYFSSSQFTIPVYVLLSIPILKCSCNATYPNTANNGIGHLLFQKKNRQEIPNRVDCFIDLFFKRMDQ
jgi:hypothetical protein